MLANLLQLYGHQSVVLYTVAPGALASQLHAGVTQINLARPSKFNFLYMRRMVKILNQYDIVHVHSAYNLRYVYIAAFLFGLRKPIFYHEHFGKYNSAVTANWQQKFILKKVTFIAVSQAVAQWAIKQVKLPANHVFVLPNTVVKEELNAKFTFPVSRRILLVSNFRREKNIAFAIELLRHLNITEGNFYLNIIGQKVDENYYAEIKALINKYGLSSAVSVIGDCSNIQPLLHQYHLAIHCSNFETGPLVLIEYLAQGLPFITYNTGEVVQTTSAYLPQLIMPDFDVAKWAQQIENIALQPQQTLRQQLITLYNHHFSPETYYESCINIYQKGLSIVKTNGK